MSNKRHWLRRILLVLIPIVISGILVIILCNELTKSKFVIDSANMIDVSKVMIGVWGTLLGFIITAESILVAFGNGTITSEFKKTGHYMTVIFQYTQTSMKILIYIAVFMYIIIVNSFSVTQMLLFTFFSLMTFIDILICFVILVLMLKMAHN